MIGRATCLEKEVSTFGTCKVILSKISNMIINLGATDTQN